MISTNRSSIIHSIEGSNLINTHWWHLQHPSNLVHNADACEPMLSLSNIKQWHYCGLLVLWWVSGEDLLNELLILCGELKGYRGIIVVGVAVL
jgi:hypothetical protein